MPPQRQKPPRYQPPNPVPTAPEIPSCGVLESEMTALRDAMSTIKTEIENTQKEINDWFLDCSRERAEGNAWGAWWVNPVCKTYIEKVDTYTKLNKDYQDKFNEFITKSNQWSQKYPQCNPPPCSEGNASKVIRASMVYGEDITIPDPDTSSIDADRLKYDNEKNEQNIKITNANATIRTINQIPDALKDRNTRQEKMQYLLNSIDSAVNHTGVTGVTQADKDEFLRQLKNTHPETGIYTDNSVNLGLYFFEEMRARNETIVTNAEDRIKQLVKLIADLDKEKEKLTSSEYINERQQKIVAAANDCIKQHTTGVISCTITFANASTDAMASTGSLGTTEDTKELTKAATSLNNDIFSIDISKAESILEKHFGAKANCYGGSPVTGKGPWTYPITVEAKLQVTRDTNKLLTCLDASPDIKFDIDNSNNQIQNIVRAAVSTFINNSPNPNPIVINHCKGP